MYSCRHPSWFPRRHPSLNPQVGRLSSGSWGGCPGPVGLQAWGTSLHLLPWKLLHQLRLGKHQSLFPGLIFHICCQSLIQLHHVHPGMVMFSALPPLTLMVSAPKKRFSPRPQGRDALSTLVLLGVYPLLLFKSLTFTWVNNLPQITGRSLLHSEAFPDYWTQR